MAVVNIEFIATSNLSQMAGEINRVNASLKAMNQNMGADDLNAINNAFKVYNASLSNSGQYTSHLASIASAEARWGKSLSENKLRLRDYNKELGNHIRGRDSMIKKLAAQQVAIERSTIISRGLDDRGQRLVNIATPTGINQVASGMELARKRAQIFNEVISKSAGKVIDLGKNVQWAGRQMMVGMTIPVGIFAAAAGKAFYGLDQQLTRLVKVYGNLGTALNPEQIAKLRAEVVGLGKDMASTYGASMDQTVGLAADFAATGAEGKDLLNQTAAATRLAVLGEVDRQDAMRTTLSLTTAFKVQTKDLADAVNFLNAVENQTSVSLQDLTVAIPKAGPVVKGLGGDFKDLALYMTAMKEGGISAGEGANAIKSGLVSIINPTKKATEFLAKFQIDLPQIVQDNAGNITGTIMELKKALDQLDPLTRQQALANLFQKYQVARMTALFNNIGESDQTKRVLEMMQASGDQLAQVADRELNTIANSASGKWNRALETFKANLASIGEEFLTIGTYAVNAASAVVKFFDGLPGWLKNVVIVGTIFAALVGPIVMTAGIFLNFFGTIVKAAVFLKMLHNRTRGLGGAFEYLTPEIFAANKISEKMETTMYNQTEATNVLTGALQKLELALADVAEKGAVANAALSMDELKNAESLMAQQAARPYQAFQAGHVIPRELYASALKKGGATGAGGGFSTLAYGMTMGMESIASNADKRAGSLYGAPGMKQFDPATVIRSGASIQAWEQSLRAMPKTISIEMGKILSRYKEAIGKAGGDIGLQNQARASFITSLNQLDAKILPAFKQRFEAAERDFAREFARVAGLTDDKVLAELKKHCEQLNMDYNLMLERINKGTIDARTALVTTSTSRMSAAAIGKDVNPIVNSNADNKKRASRGMPVAAILANDYRVIDDETDILEKRATATAVREGIVDRELVAAKKADKKSRRFSGGKMMGAGMLASSIPMFMPDTGNKSVDNATNILGGAGMGASMGMMAGPWGALAGAVIGGAIPAITTLTEKMGEFERVSKAAFSVGEDAANRYGKSIKKVTEIQVAQMLGNSGVRMTKVEEIKNAMLAGPEDSADRELINFISGEGDGSAIMGRMKQRVAQLVIAGVDKKDIQDQIAALLLAAGKAGYAIPINAQLQKEGMYSLKGSLEDQIKDVTGARDPIIQAAQGFRAQVVAAFGEGAQNMINDMATGNISQSTFGMSDAQLATLEKLNIEWRKLPDEVKFAAREATIYNENLTPLVETLANAASTTPVAEFMKMTDTLDTSALSATTFAEAFGKIPGIGEDAVAAINMLSQSGANTTQMLQGISLVNAGVISSWKELQSIGPAYLKVIYETSVAENKIVDNAANAGASVFDKKANAAQASVSSGGSGGGSNKSGSGANDALNKKKKAIKDYYDAEIKKVKDAEKAKQDAADAEKRRLDRQKRDMQSMIDYREALAAGDFAAAAKIKIDIANNRKQDRLDDKARNDQSAADKRIAALEAERDAKLDAIDKVLDASKAADAATVSSAGNAANKVAEGYRAIAAEFRKLAEGNVTDFDTTMKKIIALAKTHGLSLKTTIKDTLYNLNFPDGFKDTGKEIFNVIKGDLSKAPWSMVGEVVEAAMAGNTALLARKLASLKVYIGAGYGKKGAAAVGNVNKASDPRNEARAAGGGHIRGAGTKTSDSIPAWLSNGEFVMKADAVSRYGVDFMSKINSMKFSAGGMVGAIGHNAWKHAFSNALFSTGGYASKMAYSSGGLANGGMAGNMILNMYITEPGCSAEDVYRLFERKTNQKNRRVGYNR